MLYFFSLFLLTSSTLANNDIIYPHMYTHQNLATRINCQIQEPQSFRYSSITDLWELMGGQIILEADVTLRCLGDDRGEKFETEALKYKVEVTNLQITEKKDADAKSKLRRKRGASEFFSRSWGQIKKFFRKMFGISDRHTDVTEISNQPPPDEKSEKPSSEDDESEDFNAADLHSLYSVPFQFVQLANGSIPEIRFSENEVDDVRVKNFKRHLVDAFSTQLSFNHQSSSVVEKSVMGEHTSNYNVTLSDETPITLSIAGFSAFKAEEPTVMVKKRVTENDILKLAPSEALNDRDRMDLKVEQVQIFRKGRLVSSSGVSSLILLPSLEARGSRIKREESDVTSYFKAYSSFDIQLKKRERRSTDEVDHSHWKWNENESYLPASRFAEMEDDTQRRKFRFLQESSTMNVLALFEHLLNPNTIGDYDDKMQLLFEMVENEVNLGIDKENGTISKTVRELLSKKIVQEICSNKFSACKDCLQLLAMAGGPQAEQVFLSILEDDHSVAPLHIQAIADIMSDITMPSTRFLHALQELIQKSSSAHVGAMCLSLGSLGSKASDEEKKKVSKMLTDMLSTRKDACQSDFAIIDIMEALGNLNFEGSVLEVLEVSTQCRNDIAIQIACVHALRHSIHLPLIQQWVRNALEQGDCKIIREIVGALMDRIQEVEMATDGIGWPRFEFNDIDKRLKDHLKITHCAVEDIILYFKKKKNSNANEIAHNFYGTDSEPFDNPTTDLVRQKRRAGAWDDLNCQEWTEDSNKFRPIQDKEEFASDRATYNKRKSCLAHRRLGVKGANAEIHAGMFAGIKEPSDPPKYKLFTKFVSGLNFLGHQLEIGSFYFYHQSGNTKAYVRILGRTRQEFTHEGCTPTDLRYRPLKHIPLYLVNVGPVQLSLGIHLSSQLAVDTVCPEKDVYQLQPLTNVRIGGEAMGTILLARGAVNLGGNFNYKLQFTFTPSPNMCLKGSHGYDPMSISFETYFQLWNVLKSDWGKPRTWRPSFLSWDVTRGDQKPWFDNTCIATSNFSSPLDTERELE